MKTLSEHSPDLLLSVEHLTKEFGSGTGTVRAVAGVSFTVRRGKITGLVGESGCGKTTVGRCLLRLLEPSGGRAIFDGADLFAMSPRQFREYRKRIQIIFQDPYSSLNPRMRIEDIIGEAVNVAQSSSRTKRRERVLELISQVGLSPEHARRYPNEFSGGQRQRIGIARALAVRPDFIIADEPVSALDVSVQAQILNLLQNLQTQHGLTMLFISHDLSVIEYLCDDVVVMYLGRVMERGPAWQLYTTPRHPYTRALISSSPVAKPSGDRRRITLRGDIPSPLDPPSGCVFRTRCPHAISACADTEPASVDVGGGCFVACIRHEELMNVET